MIYYRSINRNNNGLSLRGYGTVYRAGDTSAHTKVSGDQTKGVYKHLDDNFNDFFFHNRGFICIFASKNKHYLLNCQLTRTKINTI